MKTQLLLTSLTLSLSTAAFAASASFDRTLNVSAGPAVSVFTRSGSVRIHAGSDNAIHIVGQVHSSNGWAFNGRDTDSDRIKQIAANPPIEQSGNEITIGDRHSSELYRGISIDYDVTLPRASTISAVTGSGDLEIQDAGTSLKAQSGSGSIRAHDIHGPATLGTGSGDIDLQQSAGGDVKAETGSGSIHLSGTIAGLKAGTGSGDIEVAGQPGSDWRLNTGSGSIRISAGSSARFDLNAETGSGSIRTVQPISLQGEINRHHISGVVNGGGPLLRVSTGSGDIEIR